MGRHTRPGTTTLALAPLASAMVGLFVVALDMTAITIALPSIKVHFDGSLSDQQWILNAYMLVFGAGLLSSGSLADRIGARRAYVAGLILFAATSLLAAAAPILSVLIAARLGQGAAAAVIAPASMSLLREHHDDLPSRTRAVALWSAAGGVATTCGPLVGGALASVNWRLVFLINLPPCLLGLAFASRVPRSPRRSVPFDWPGQMLALLSVGAITYAATRASEEGVSVRVAAAGVAAVAGLVIFLVVQSRSAQPMLPLKLFREPRFSIPVSVGFTFMVGFYGTGFIFSLLLQELRGLSPRSAALTFVPMMAIAAAVNLVASRLLTLVGARRLVITGQIAMVASLLLLAKRGASADPVQLAWILAPMGLAVSLFMPAIVVFLLNAVPSHLGGTVSGAFNASRQLGGVFAIATFGLLLGPAVDSSRVRVSLLIAAALTAATSVACFWLQPSGSEASQGSGGEAAEPAFVDTVGNV